MNPGMVVKLRPAGPWRIGPDSGARNRVDAIYHSDTLYGAVTSAMAVLGSREEWLDATARAAVPAVCFSSCFPFVDEIGFVAPPRTVWPPSSPALMAARVRWKSARFVPLGIVQAILAGQRLDDAQWTVDGPSECLLPVGRPGPFRMGVRWNAAVDRLSGAAERHSTACLEFRPGAGLWTVVSFADDAARDRWAGSVKAAFRWLADSGFGGERSRGWGRSEAPEFVEGMLPEMILPVTAAEEKSPRPVEEPPVKAPPVKEPPAEEPPVEDPPPAEEPPPSEEPPPVQEPPAEASAAEEPAPLEEASVTSAPEVSAMTAPRPESTPEAAAAEDLTAAPESSEASAVETPAGNSEAATPEAAPAKDLAAASESSEASAVETSAGSSELPTSEAAPAEELTASQSSEASASEASAPGEETAPASAGSHAEESAPAEVAVTRAPEVSAESVTRPGASHPRAPFWLLSLYTPSPDDAVDWARGNYSLLTRGGRVDATGELKKQLPMVAEGSVLYAGGALRGSAPDVAPDGFAHPVFRAGFAVSIPLPEAGQ